ncbi:MAG: NAD-dependent epimerase/dehydratase family protein [Patescibacteria group bacterium]
MYKNILVTGGNGFIGSHVVENLLNKGHVPIIFDRKGPTAQVKGVSYFWGDIINKNSVDEAVLNSDGVIDLAGILGTSETVDNPFPCIETNILGALNVFEACRSHVKPAVQISLGNFWMNNPYSISKNTAERLALMYNKEHGTRIAIVRGLNAYGEGQKHAPVRKIIPNFIVRALRNTPIEIYGDGS